MADRYSVWLFLFDLYSESDSESMQDRKRESSIVTGVDHKPGTPSGSAPLVAGIQAFEPSSPTSEDEQ